MAKNTTPKPTSAESAVTEARTDVDAATARKVTAAKVVERKRAKVETESATLGALRAETKTRQAVVTAATNDVTKITDEIAGIVGDPVLSANRRASAAWGRVTVAEARADVAAHRGKVARQAVKVADARTAVSTARVDVAKETARVADARAALAAARAALKG